jgi:nucleoside-diphosphate-sugar epimerase
MRVIVFGSSGKVGRGLVQALKDTKENEVFTPTSVEIDLKNGKDTSYYVNKVQPDVVINAAGTTTDKDSIETNPTKSQKSNAIISQNLFNVMRQFHSSIYIEIGSASIYQNFEKQNVSELDFNKIFRHYPKYIYARNKARQSIRIFKAANDGLKMYSLILPNVVYTDKSLEINPGLFNRISASVLESVSAKNTFKLDPWIDGNMVRQFIHSYDVGKLCAKIIKGKLKAGIVHIPNLPKMSINQFVQDHLHLLDQQESLQLAGTFNQRPHLVSTHSEALEINFSYDSKNITKKLLVQ